MTENNGYWKLHCSFPIENKIISIELPLDIEFKLNVIANKNKISPEKLASIIIQEYIRNNYQNKKIYDLFK